MSLYWKGADYKLFYLNICAVFHMSVLPVCLEQCKPPLNTRKHSVSKSLRHLFQPTSKFVKNLKRWEKTTSENGCCNIERSQHTLSCIIYDASLPLCRGLYLACILYKDENILVTSEDQLPVVEVDDSYSCHAQDLLWFTKVTKCIGIRLPWGKTAI